MNPNATDLLKDLRTAIVRALSGSSEVRDLFGKVRDEGYSLYFVVNKNGEAEPFKCDAEMASDTNPVFRIDGQDLSILRSLGIDPTRSTRRR